MYRYSKITQKSGNIGGQIPCQIVVKYSSIRVFEYLSLHINNGLLQFVIRVLPDFIRHTRVLIFILKSTHGVSLDGITKSVHS